MGPTEGMLNPAPLTSKVLELKGGGGEGGLQFDFASMRTGWDGAEGGIGA